MYREIIKIYILQVQVRNPGAGVPIVLTSAKITVDEMIKDIEQGV